VTLLLVALVVLGVNLLPAFGPPTWTILVYAKLRWGINPVALVAVGAGASLVGRYLLGQSAARLAHRLPARYRRNLEALHQRLTHVEGGTFGLVALYTWAPIPSAQLFMAGGLLELPLERLALWFGLGRIIIYGIYVAGATVAASTFKSLLHSLWGSPWAIVLQAIFLIALTVLPLISWRARPAEPAGEVD